MGTARQHEYRFKYLKSDEWLTVRAEALVREDACCQICGLRDLSNDAHHVAYPPSFWDTRAYHLVVLCRPCHDLCHSILGFDGDKDHCLKRFLEVAEALKEWKAQLQLEKPRVTSISMSPSSNATIATIKPEGIEITKSKRAGDFLREELEKHRLIRDGLISEFKTLWPSVEIPAMPIVEPSAKMKPSDHLRNRLKEFRNHVKLLKTALQLQKDRTESAKEREHHARDYMHATDYMFL